MRSISLMAVTSCAALAVATQALPDDAGQASEVISLERAALERWGHGDPQGFLDIYAPEITYFDVATDSRIDGHSAMSGYYRPIRGKIRIAHYEMIAPKVQRHGDVAVLTYNLHDEAVQPDGKHLTMSWNSTSVYAQLHGEWKVIHSHWSLTAPPCLRRTM